MKQQATVFQEMKNVLLSQRSSLKEQLAILHNLKKTSIALDSQILIQTERNECSKIPKHNIHNSNVKDDEPIPDDLFPVKKGKLLVLNSRHQQA